MISTELDISNISGDRTCLGLLAPSLGVEIQELSGSICSRCRTLMVPEKLKPPGNLQIHAEPRQCVSDCTSVFHKFSRHFTPS
jgi:hypothetical protein